MSDTVTQGEGEVVLESITRWSLDQLLRRIRYGRLDVTDWTGKVRKYGKSGPLVEVEIKDEQVVRQLAINASLAVGEAYADKRLLIPSDQLLAFFELIARNQPSFTRRQPYRRQRNGRPMQQSNIAHHYDVGNEYYDLFLGETRMYSCARFNSAYDTLETAQRNKIYNLLRKLRLADGQRLLDIGCGWGHLTVAAAKMFDIEALGITLSQEQLKGATELAQREGVADRVRFRLVNYQDLQDRRFDRIISVGMFEHVGRDQQRRYFDKVANLLTDGGVSVLHTITQQYPMPVNAWVDKYIFPGGHLPTRGELEDGIDASGMWAIDTENLWHHYARTLHIWRERHQKHRRKIIDMFDERFYRMRDFWLAGSEAGFQFGRLGLAQIIFAKGKPSEWPLTRKYQDV